MIFQTPKELLAHNEALDFVCTSGGFDPLHVGHLRCIQETVDIAGQTGCSSVIIVNGDGFLTRKKGRPFMSHQERMEIVDGIKGVDYVVGWEDDTQTVVGCLEALGSRVSAFTKGGDRSDPSKVPEYETCQKIGCELIFGVGGGKIQSSSDLIEHATETGDLDAFDMVAQSCNFDDDIREARIVKKPWGREEILVHTDRYAAKIITIMPGRQLSRQYHEIKDEAVYVLSGALAIEFGEDGEDISFLQAGMCKRIPAGTIHRFRSWQGHVKLFEVSTPELNDVVRLADDYGRAS